MAISPDGRLVVSVDMQGSYFPPSDPRRTRCSTLTLLRCDAAAGTLDRIGSFDFDGLLPESAVFDRSGRHLAVANFGDLDDPTAPGTVDFWRVIPDPLDAGSVRLVQTHRSIALQRGVMQLNIPGQY